LTVDDLGFLDNCANLSTTSGTTPAKMTVGGFFRLGILRILLASRESAAFVEQDARESTRPDGDQTSIDVVVFPTTTVRASVSRCAVGDC